MNEPVNHHYLPVFYLRRWTGSDGRVVRYHRPHNRVVVSRLAPEHTGFENRLYTLDGVADSQVVETGFFSPVDNTAAPVLERLIANGPDSLDNQARGFWTRFIMSLQLRGPHSLTEVKSVLDRNFRANIKSVNEEYLKTKKEGDPASVYEYVLQQAPHQFTNAHKALLPRLIDDEFLGQLIINMRWEVMDLSSAAHTLLTADRPFNTSHGLADPACLLCVPLSPRHLFVAANHIERLQILRAQSSSYTVRDSNDLVVKLAVQNVYGCADSHLAFVEKRLRRANNPPIPGVITREYQR